MFRSRVKIPVIFLVPVMFLATLYCTLYFYLNSDLLLQRVPDGLHALFGGDFEVAELVVGPTLTNVHLYGATIRKSKGDPAIIDAPEVHASLDPLHLLNRRIVLDRGHVRGATVRLAFDEDNDLNLLEALGIDPPDEPPDSDPWLSFAFENLEAEESEFILVRDEFELRIPQVHIPDGRVAIETGVLQMAVEKLDVPRVDFRFHPHLFGFEPAYGDWTFSAEDIRIRDWRWQDDGFWVEHVEFWAEGARATASGRMEFPYRPPDGPDDEGEAGMRYEGTAQVSFPYWSPLVQYFIRDTVHFEIPEAGISVEGSLEMIDGVFEARADVLETAGLRFTDVAGEATLQDQHILLRKGRADLHGGTVKLDWAYFDILEVAYGAVGRFDGVNPASLLGDFDVDLPWLAGALSGGVSVEGAVPMGRDFEVDDPLAFVEDATRELADVEVTEPWRFEPDQPMPGPAEALRVERGSQIRVNYERVMLADAVMRAGSDHLDVERFELDYGEMALSSPGPVDPVALTLHLSRIAPYAEWLGLSGVDGRLEAWLRAGGPIDAPRARFRAGIEDFEVVTGAETFRGQHVGLAGRLEDGVLRVPSFGVESDAGTLEGQGRARLWGGRRFLEGSYRADGVALDVLDRVLGLGMGLFGELDVSGELEGTPTRPRASFQATMADGGFRGLSLRSVEARGEVGLDGVEMEDLDVGLDGGGAIDARGRLGFADTSYQFRAAARDVDVGAVALAGGLSASYQPEGTLRARLHGAGTLAEPRVAGDLEIDMLRVGEQKLGDVAMVVDTVDGALHLVGAVPSLASLTAELPLSGEEWYQVRVGAEHLDLTEWVGPLASMAAIERLVTTGAINLDVAPDFGDYNVSTHLDELVLETPEATFRNRGPVDLGVNRRGRLQIESLQLGSGGRYLKIGGGLVLDKGLSALWSGEDWQILTSLRVEGQMNLRLVDVLGTYVLTDVLPETLVESEGLMQVDLDINGPFGRPKPTGTVSFQQASFQLRGFGDPLRIQHGTAHFEEHGVEIPASEEFVGEFLGGVFSLSGLADYPGGKQQASTLELWSHNMVYRLPQQANLTFDTDLELTAGSLLRPETWEVGGRVTILNALYYRNISLLEEQLAGRVLGAFSRRTERYEVGLLESQPWIGDIDFDVGIRARDGVRIESAIDRFALDLEMRLDLRLQETLREPRLTGEVDVLDGTVDFQGEVFEVRRGTIEYTGSPTNPRVTIVAGADIRNRCAESATTRDFTETFSFAGDFDEARQELYHVMLDVEGPLENLNIALESNPYADQRDILSLILTGCTVDALTASGATQPTLEIALGPLLGRFEREVRDVVELSEFSIMPGVERTQVRIGDRVTRRLVWRFQLDTGLSEREGGQRYQLEYRLSDRWSAELSERSRGETEDFLLDLKLKYRLPLD